MKIFIMLLMLWTITACEAGKFTPKRHGYYELGRPDCEKTPERCINGYPW